MLQIMKIHDMNQPTKLKQIEHQQHHSMIIYNNSSYEKIYII